MSNVASKRIKKCFWQHQSYLHKLVGYYITVGWHIKILKNNIGIMALGDGLGIN